MATATPRPSTTSSRIRSKTSELSDLFRGRQHSSIPPPTTDSSTKPKRKIPLFGLRKKSPAPRPGQRSPSLTPAPTPRPSTNVTPLSPSESTNTARSQLPQLTIPPTSFSPLPTFEDASSKRSSTSPTNSRSTRSTARSPPSNSSNGLNKSRTPTPTSAAALGGSFSDSEPPRSASVRTRTPTLLLRSYASDDEDRKYLSARILPPAKPPPTTPLPPPPEDDPTELGTPPSLGSPHIFFPGQAGPYDAKLPTPSGRKPAISTPRSPSHRFTSGSESASESAQGYTSASGSESATTGLGLGFRIRTRSGQGSAIDLSSTSRAASVRVGLLRTPNPLTGSRSLSPTLPKSPVASSKSSPSVLLTSERTVSPRPGPVSHSSAKRVSPPIQSATLKPPETPGGKQPEPGTAGSSTKHASWLVVPKAAHTSPINPPGHASVQDSKVTVPSKLRARSASDSRMLSTTAAASSPIGANLPASSAVGASGQSITATRSSSAPTSTSPSNSSKSPSTAAASSTLTNRAGLCSSSPPPAEPLPGLPRSSLSRGSSESSRQASSRSSSSPSSSESSSRTLTVPTAPLSASNASCASGSGTVGGSTTDTLAPGSTAPSAFRSPPPTIVSTASGPVRRPRDERPTNKDKNKGSTWPPQSGSKRSSPTVPSPLVQSHTSSESLPYAPPSSFSASTMASQPPSSPQPPPSRVVVPIPPTPANVFALQTENADLRAEIASLRSQLESVERIVKRREREIRGLRWLVVNWGGEKKEEFGFTAFTERRPSDESGEIAESQEEVQAAVRYLRAESESGYGSGSVSGSQSRLSHSSAYSSVYPAESVSEGSGSEIGITQRFGPGPRARASEDQALDAIPERTVIGGEDASQTEAELRWKKDERRASRALKRLSSSTASDVSGGPDKVVAQPPQTSNLLPGPAMSIEQVIEGDRSRRERIGLKGMDEVLDKLRAAAGAKRP